MTSKEIKENKKRKDKISIKDNMLSIKRLSMYHVAKEYDLYNISKLFGKKTIAIDNSVFGCKYSKEQMDKFLTSDDIINFEELNYVNPFDLSQNQSNSNFSYIFWFEYGVIVFWNVLEDIEKKIIERIRPYEDRSTGLEADSLTYTEKSREGTIPEDFNAKTYINKDNIVMMTEEFEEKLAVSFAIAQSIKLTYLEGNIYDAVNETKVLAEELSKNGYLQMETKDLKKKMAMIYLKKNEVNLETDILDTPEYFWDNDKYQNNFQSVLKYFEIPKRVELLNHRLDIISKFLKTLVEESNVMIYSKLEWSVIILILIYVLKLFIWDIIAKDIFRLVR